MDKRSLSNYGWVIVVVIIILILMSTMPGFIALFKVQIPKVTKDVGSPIKDVFGPVLMPHDDEKAFWTVKNDIHTITFQTTMSIPDHFAHAWDVSEDGNGAVYTSGDDTKNKIIAYLTEAGDLFICSDGKMKANKDSSLYFANMMNVTSIVINDSVDTFATTNMSGMFSWLPSLTTLNLSSFDTSNVKDMSWMFAMPGVPFPLSQMTSLDISSFNTMNVNNMEGMFCNCVALTSLNVNHFDTKKVVNMDCMFCDCKSLLSLDVSNFNTSAVTDMGTMFSGCESLVSLDLHTFDTHNVTIMGSMFQQCGALVNLNVANFDTSSVESFNCMFSNANTITTLHLESFNTKDAYDFSYMFTATTHLQHIYVGENWSTANADEYGMYDTFDGSGCSTVTVVS